MARPILRHPLPPAAHPHGGRASAHRRSRDLLAVVICCALLLAACGSARTGKDTAAPTEDILASASSNAADAAAEKTPDLSASLSEAARAPGIAPCWQPLAARLKADGLAGPRVDALLATLSSTPTQSPMGRKIRELYRRRFLPRPPAAKPAPLYYKGVVTEANAALCRDFIDEHKAAFAAADARYGVSPAIAASLLFVETRLGKVLGDVAENAFYTLASMAVSTTPESISHWLAQLPGYQTHLPWLQEILHKRADWAYGETRALVEHMLRDHIPPERLPGSIYGAVGLCQFMPSNISTYGADGDGDGRVDLFTAPDAIASLAHYLARHGWKAGLSRERQHSLLMTYNHSRTYANTILALSDLVAHAPDTGGEARP
ncbi:lytic murein transglycosylase [Desulfovibrio sp.]|uniref:lytic murein transglycosylase n=1 Tax=Desulfovibrio sp. TaxID=885 RepID=UPI0023CC9424|nr:lytic murein transglycosylase [Desulfovibrio sp.]MDE7242273.1 lytic murein transglycosylase [Desulfovibrio sp.]